MRRWRATRRCSSSSTGGAKGLGGRLAVHDALQDGNCASAARRPQQPLGRHALHAGAPGGRQGALSRRYSKQRTALRLLDWSPCAAAAHHVRIKQAAARRDTNPDQSHGCNPAAAAAGKILPGSIKCQRMHPSIHPLGWRARRHITPAAMQCSPAPTKHACTLLRSGAAP